MRAADSSIVITVATFFASLGLGLCVAPTLGWDDYRIEGVITEWPLTPPFGDLDPKALAVDAAGRVFVAFWHAPVFVYDDQGQLLGQFGQDCGCGYCSYTCNCPPGQFRGIQGLTVDDAGTVFVSDDCMQRVQKFTVSPVPGGVSVVYAGEIPVTVDPAGSWRTYPYGLAVGPSGDLYVSGYWSARVMRYTSDGVLLGSFDGSLTLPIDVDVDSSGRVLVAQHWALPYWTGGDSVAVFEPGGAHLASLGSQGPNPTWPWQPWNAPPPPHGDAEFQGMVSLAVDDRDVVYVLDRDNHRIQAFGADGGYLGWYGRGTATSGWHEPATGETPLAGSANGALWFPRALAIGPDRSIYVAELGAYVTPGDERVVRLGRLSYTTEELLGALAADVAALHDEGVLNRGQANALTVKLAQIERRLESGNYNSAVNIVGAFLYQVADWVASGVLPPEDGDYLTHWGEVVRDEILAMM